MSVADKNTAVTGRLIVAGCGIEREEKKRKIKEGRKKEIKGRNDRFT
jgi:hypothetical protein